MKFLLNIKIKNRGFTILELLVSLTIFAIMTALLLSKYGTFNQGVILTNLAYDIALTIRNAQMYGLNVKSSGRTVNDFSNPYGVYFDTSTAASKILVTSFIDLKQGNMYNPDNLYNNSQADINPATGMPYEFLTSSTIKNGGYIGSIRTCNNYKCTNPITRTNVSIVFKRPKPDALIYTNPNTFFNGFQKVMIDVKSSDGNTRTITVTDNGEISVDQ